MASRKLSTPMSSAAGATPTDVSASMADTMSTLKTPSKFSFSTVPVDKLAAIANEFTLATLVVDESSSVYDFAKDLEKCAKTVLESCATSPRSDNLLLRFLKFCGKVEEVHGFRPLAEINSDEYTGKINPSGSTALFDAVTNAVEASEVLGENLVNQEFTANAVIFVLTDGEDNMSRTTPNSIRKALDRIAKAEKLESVAVILIQVGTKDAGVKAALDRFATEAKLTQLIDLTDLFASAKPGKALAKLAGFITRSISSTSTALASGSSTAASSKLTI